MNTKAITPILLIEDNPGDAQLVRLYLKDASSKFELNHVETFFEGVQYVKEHPVSLVLLDLSLPDISGFKTLTNFLVKAPNVPVIILTGTNNEIIGNQAIKAGAQDFLVKGQFDGKLLGRAIRYSIQRYKTQVKLEQTATNLALSEKRYVEAQEMAHFGNWELDIVTNKMQWTDEVYRIFGFAPGSLSPSLSDYMSYVHFEDNENVESFFENVIKDGQKHTLEHKIVVDGRNIKHVSIQAKVYYEDLTKKLVLVGGIQDITERKQAEQLIIEKNISRGTSKIKEEALSDMSFHIRTPLSSIVNLLYVLERTNVNAQQKELVDGLKVSVDDLYIMLNNLLNFSLLNAETLKLEIEDFRVKDFLQSTNKIIQIKADNANVHLAFHAADNLPEVLQGDAKKITQILFNLIDNAIHFSDTKSSIIFQNTIKEFSKDRSHLCFTIKGNSRLLNEEKLKELSEAEKLLQVYMEDEIEPNKQQLGMAIASKLCDLLHGKLMITGDGASAYVFHVEIPVRPMQTVKLNAGDKPDAPIQILLVEDHFLNQIATRRVLTTWSDFVTVDIAENGLISVEKERAHHYDLILMDIQMPIMNGFEAAKKIRERSDIPIIALTANATKQEMNKCKEVGMNDYLSKPFKPEELQAKVMNLLASVNVDKTV